MYGRFRTAASIRTPWFEGAGRRTQDVVDVEGARRVDVRRVKGRSRECDAMQSARGRAAIRPAADMFAPTRHGVSSAQTLVVWVPYTPTCLKLER